MKDSIRSKITEGNMSIRELKRMERQKRFEEEERKKKESQFKLVGELTLVNDEKTFKKLHPNESNVDYKGCEKPYSMKLIDNGPKYTRYINPYEKMVNIAMIDTNQNCTKFSFKSKAFYEKAIELSERPQLAKMDSNNPIFLYIYNPKDYRYYNLDSI